MTFSLLTRTAASRIGGLLSLTALFGGGIAQAQVTAVPTQVAFQGRVATPSGNPFSDGTYSIKFSFYDAVTGGTLKQTQTISSVQVKNGTFAVALDATTAGLFDGSLWLEIKIGNDAPLTPRQKVLTVPFAFKANTVPDFSITATKIAVGAVTPAKILSSEAALNPVSGGSLSLIGGHLIYPNGTIQNTTAALSTTDLGFYSQVNGNWIRFVTNNAPFKWFSDNGIGTNPNMTLEAAGILRLTNAISQFGSTLNMIDTASDSTDGTALRLTNSSGGGRDWSMISAGSNSSGNAGNLIFRSNSANVATLKPTGEFITAIVTITGGSDVAEPYHIAPAKSTLPLPGMVVCIDRTNVGRMRVASKPYDRTVAGIISGANGIKPGITLRQTGTVADGELPVASIGRVWCWCDAGANGAIEAGDMLTTSPTAGHAMRVTGYSAANGAVIGKAMSSLKHGKGLVLVLVSLK